MLRQLTADNFYHVSTLNCLTATVHKYGAKIFAQLHHGGSTNDPSINGGKIYSASDVPNVSGIVPEPMTAEQLLEEGYCDFVAVGRGQLADPDCGAAYLAGLTAKYKEKILWLIDTMTKELKDSGVKIVLNADVTPEKVSKINPVAVFLACGAEQIHPKLPGLDSDKVIMASNVTIIDMLPQLGQGMYTVIFMDIMKQLNPHAPVLMPGHKIEGLNGNTLKLTEVATGKEVCIEVDNVVLAMGNRPDKDSEIRFSESLLISHHQAAVF